MGGWGGEKGGHVGGGKGGGGVGEFFGLGEGVGGVEDVVEGLGLGGGGGDGFVEFFFEEGLLGLGDVFGGLFEGGRGVDGVGAGEGGEGAVGMEDAEVGDEGAVVAPHVDVPATLEAMDFDVEGLVGFRALGVEAGDVVDAEDEGGIFAGELAGLLKLVGEDVPVGVGAVGVDFDEE